MRGFETLAVEYGKSKMKQAKRRDIVDDSEDDREVHQLTGASTRKDGLRNRRARKGYST